MASLNRIAKINNVYNSLCRVRIFLVLVYNASEDVHLEFRNHSLVVSNNHATDVSSTADKLPLSSIHFLVSPSILVLVVFHFSRDGRLRYLVVSWACIRIWFRIPMRWMAFSGAKCDQKGCENGVNSGLQDWYRLSGAEFSQGQVSTCG